VNGRGRGGEGWGGGKGGGVLGGGLLTAGHCISNGTSSPLTAADSKNDIAFNGGNMATSCSAATLYTAVSDCMAFKLSISFLSRNSLSYLQLSHH